VTSEPALSLRGVHKRFGRREALRGIELAVNRGEIVGLLGPNGSGKTTALRIAAGLCAPDAGEVTLGAFSGNAEVARRAIGYLPERAPLYDALTVRRYLEFAARAKRIAGVNRSSAIGDVLTQCQLDTVAAERIGRLSKGFRQRVGFAQALLGDPALLLLDEATGGLDPLQAIAARTVLRRDAGRRAVLFSTHILREAEALCTRVVVLHEGRVAAHYAPAAPGATPALSPLERVFVDSVAVFSEEE